MSTPTKGPARPTGGICAPLAPGHAASRPEPLPPDGWSVRIVPVGALWLAEVFHARTRESLRGRGETPLRAASNLVRSFGLFARAPELVARLVAILRPP